MFSFFSLLFALRVGTVAIHPGAPTISVRAEARAVAAELSSSALLEETPALSARPRAPAWPLAQGGPPVGPVFPAYRPEEWVSMIARQLNIADTGVAHAAMWVSAWPVRVDVSPRHVYVTVRLRGP